MICEEEFPWSVPITFLFLPARKVGGGVPRRAEKLPKNRLAPDLYKRFLTGYNHSQKPIVIMNDNRVEVCWYPQTVDDILAWFEMKNEKVDDGDDKMTRYEMQLHSS